MSTAFEYGREDARKDKTNNCTNVFSAEKIRRDMSMSIGWNWKDWQDYRKGYLTYKP